MSVLDQLRSVDQLRTRQTELARRAQALVDVLTGDLDGQELFDRLQACTDELAAYLVELDDEPPTSGFSTLAEEPKTGSPTGSKDAAAPIVAKKTRKAAKKATAKKAARRSRPSPEDGAAGKVTEKRCSKCKQTKPVAEFGRNKAARDGIAYWCKICTKAVAAERYQRNRADRPEQPTQATATVTPITVATDDLVAVCPVHSVVARQPRGEVTVPDEAWLFKARSNHRLKDRCERELALQGRAA